jgi:hypothetical protein
MVRPVTETQLLTSVSTVEALLDERTSELGPDFIAYRNHVYRVLNLCVEIVGGRSELEKIAIAAVFHDLGIWTDKTFDYIGPSVAIARDYLTRSGRPDWVADVEPMIGDHHKISTSSAAGGLAESFRRADWIDVTRGLRRFGVPRAFVRSVFETWPSAGFHKRLLALTLQRFRTHPLTPLPMVRW